MTFKDRLNLEDAQKACFRKVVYWTKNAARDAAAKIKKRDGFELHPYKCLVCGHHHLTRADKQRQPAIRQMLLKRA